MKKILIIDTTWPINSRTERFRKTLQEKYHVIVSAWKRDGKPEDPREDLHIMVNNIGYGNQILKLIKLPLFILHNFNVCKKNNPDIIFASHWDSLICAAFIKALFFRRIKIIYDCLDLPTTSNYFIRKFLQLIEKTSLKYVDITIFASRYFESLYPKKINSIIFENYPPKSSLTPYHSQPSWFKDYDIVTIKNTKTVSWIGVVRYLNILENILDAIKDTDIHFLVFGTGPDLEKLQAAVIQKNLNKQVHFFGRYEHADLNFIYSISELIWAAYPTSDHNAVYAISNKYFECSSFEKTPIISKKTKMAEYLRGRKNAILIDEFNVNEIRNSFFDYFNNGKDDEPFEKYEPDASWEDRENLLIEYLEKNLP
ncbi:glycosyltransferase [Paenalcaligenes sp. Me52]|uniref:glycosyltransferase n=1 Tax=Paenalcaligenes sp. Me52 TaxID=3392038 RepID=UPI003D2CE703